MKTIIRLFLVVILTIVLGVIYNQYHPNGIRWQFLLPPTILENPDNSNFISVITPDSPFILTQSEAIGFLDIRKSEDFQLDHIKGAKNIPLASIFDKEFLNELINTSYIIYDQDGEYQNLNLAAHNLINCGYKPVYILFGGYLSWLERNYPIE